MVDCDVTTHHDKQVILAYSHLELGRIPRAFVLYRRSLLLAAATRLHENGLSCVNANVFTTTSRRVDSSNPLALPSQ